MKRVLLILVFFAPGFYSQDIHFSQFNENPSLLNPALCGADDTRRFAINFKDQWGSVTVPYRTYGVSFDTRFNSGNWKQVDNFRSMTFKQRSTGRMAAGISIYNDEAGDGRLGQTQANLSLASFVPISKESFFSVGLQGSFVQRKINYSTLRFPDQFEGSQFDPMMSSGEDFTALNFMYADLGTGLLWSYGGNSQVISVEQMRKAKIGISFYHLLAPQQKFIRNSMEQLYIKKVFHGDFTFGIRNTNSALSPAFLVTLQGPSREIVFGGMIKTFTNDHSKYTGLVNRTCFGYGVYYRVKDALILSTMFDWKQRYCMTISYDVNLSALSASSAFRGGLELSLRITPGVAYLYQEKKKPIY